MLGRNIDFLAIAIVAVAMSLISHIPPPAATFKVIRYQIGAPGPVQEQRCPLQEFLSKITD